MEILCVGVGVIMYVCESYGCVRVFLVECNFEVVNLLHGGDDNDDDDGPCELDESAIKQRAFPADRRFFRMKRGRVK